MSFENCLPQVYSADSIRKNAPMESGVYGLSNSLHWLYVGQSGNIRDSLLKHLMDSGTDREHAPTGFRFELSPEQSRLHRQQSLILELGPTRQRGGSTPGRRSY